VAVAPADKPGQYVVTFAIAEGTRDGEVKVVSAPKLTVEAGKPGRLEIGAAGSADTITCTALVTERPDAVEAVTAVRVREAGKDVLDLKQTMVTRKAAASAAD
jgi:hypothetical protein